MLAVAAAVLAPAHPAPAAGPPAGRGPDALWHAYPLDASRAPANGDATSQAPAPGNASPELRQAPPAAIGASPPGPPPRSSSWLLLLGGVLAGVLGGLVVPLPGRRERGPSAVRARFASLAHAGSSAAGLAGRAAGAAAPAVRRRPQPDPGPSGSGADRPGAALEAPRARRDGLAVVPAAALDLRPPPPASRPWAAPPAVEPLRAPLPLPLPLVHREPRERIWPRISPRTRRLVLAGILLVGAGLRVWQINALGLNSDETVYAGQGASIAGVADLAPYFPTFRAHPLLFQSLLSIGFLLHAPEVFGRLVSVALGLATVYVTYRLARLLYGTRAGLIAGGLLALMPYHVVVTRQILLDGPRALMSTLTLYLLARFALTERKVWFYAAAGGLGLTFLCKEDSVIMVGSIYAFLALTPGLRTGVRHVVLAGTLFVLIAAALPVSLDWAGHTGTGGNFLAWQLFRRPNHGFTFYPAVVPVAIGLGVVAAAGLGLWLLRREGSWRETLLLAWIAVPVGFFQLFPVKGFQYLLPIAPAVAVLAARFLAHWDPRSLPGRSAVPLMRRPRVRRVASSFGFLRRRRIMPIALAIVLISLAVPSWQRVQRSQATTFLAGSGGIPGGRDAGQWIAAHVPKSAQMMSIGPSMANILEFYGHRKVYGLSVSPNPLHRNPVYEAMRNPDRLIRDNELQYIVWDAFSGDRSPFFARKMMRYVERYHGHVAHTETVSAVSPDGRAVRTPVIIIYEVSP